MKAITLIYIGLVSCYAAWLVMKICEWERRFYGNKRHREFSRDGKRLIRLTVTMAVLLALLAIVSF